MAAKHGKSVAQLVRQSVEQLILTAGAIDTTKRRRRAIAAAGRFHSGLTDLAVYDDLHLAEAYEA